MSSIVSKQNETRHHAPNLDSPINFRSFQIRLTKWFNGNRRNYPWRDNKDLYSLVLAELLLQRTNADKVEPIYTDLVRKYPVSRNLADANTEELATQIKPLGLFNRVYILQSVASDISNLNVGNLTYERLLNIKGIGPYIAASVAIHFMGKRVGILDPNIIRIYERVFGYKSNSKRARNDRKLIEFSKNLLPRSQPSRYIYSLLDFGALICKARKPLCGNCPLFISVCPGFNVNPIDEQPL